MARATERIPLPAPSPGTRRELLVHRYGRRGARPKAYLQAGIHGGEIAGLLVLHHLLRRLDALVAAGQDTPGEVVVVPAANPIGLGQSLHGEFLGRFEFVSGTNFNRAFPELTEAVASRLQGALGADAEANVARVRAAIGEVLAECRAGDEPAALKLALMRLAADADVVLDLHCDGESLLHLYVNAPQWPGAADLSAELGSRVTLLEEDTGGLPLDEACALPWQRLAERYADVPLPNGCLAATVELRGRTDVSDTLAEADAGRLVRFLARRGIVGGDPGPLPEPLCEATPLAAVDLVAAPSAGVVVHKKALGDWVGAGEVVAEIVDPTAAEPSSARTPLTTRAEGRLFARHISRLARPGTIVCKVAGDKPLAQGEALED